MKQIIYIIVLQLFILSCKSPEARVPKQNSTKTGSFFIESAKRNKKLNEAERKTIEEVIANNNEVYQTSRFGFWYRYNNKVEGDSITPKYGDVIEFNYNVSNIKGQSIYTKTDIGLQTYAMDQEELFSGLREGLKLMKASEKVTFIFPSHKAFGYYGDGKKIERNMPLICEVTLININKKQNNE